MGGASRTPVQCRLTPVPCQDRGSKTPPGPHLPPAHFGTEAKAEALLTRIGEAIEAAVAGDVNNHKSGQVPAR